MAQVDMSVFLMSQAWNVPYALVYFIGLVLAVVFWRRHPEVSILCLCAFLLLLGTLVLGAGQQFWLMANRGAGPDISKVLAVLGGVRLVFVMIAWGMLLMALFGWRYPRVTDGKPPEQYAEYGGGMGPMGPTRF